MTEVLGGRKLSPEVEAILSSLLNFGIQTYEPDIDEIGEKYFKRTDCELEAAAQNPTKYNFVESKLFELNLFDDLPFIFRHSGKTLDGVYNFLNRSEDEIYQDLAIHAENVRVGFHAQLLETMNNEVCTVLGGLLDWDDIVPIFKKVYRLDISDRVGFIVGGICKDNPQKLREFFAKTDKEILHLSDKPTLEEIETAFDK
ncbi:hypothetical protein CSB09_01430 [Candidatus Gracilibacteria bacterium]|nr:MAG: hypothetical protein CSB09_01430 [Candidatus Gracilibacteria bacterium]